MGWFDRFRGTTAASASASSDALVRTSDQPFKAARRGRASSSFEGTRKHVNSAIRQGGALLRERSRFLCRENGLAISSKALFEAYTVGCGVLPAPIGLKARTKQQLMQAFYAWCRESGFLSQQKQVAAERFEAGEVFVRQIHRADRSLRLQLIASEQLPYSVINPVGKADGNTVRLGIEFNADDERVAYHFLRYHPGDATVSAKDRTRTVRVPASEVHHVYWEAQPGQLRGLPVTLGALIAANKLDEYEDALIERAISGSKVSGIIKKDATDRESGSPAMAGAEDNKDGTATLDFEVGTILELTTGEDWETVTPPDPGTNYGEFAYRQQAKACAAMGVPYLEATGDLRRAPFSAVRAGRMPFKRRIEQFQHLELVPQLLQPVWEAWLRDGLLRGTITLPRGAARTVEAYANVRWMGPKWEYIEPLKDRQAEKLAVDELFVPRSDIIAERGEDPDEIDQKIAEDQRREKRLKLVRPDTRAPAAAAEPDADDEDDKPDPEDDDK